MSLSRIFILLSPKLLSTILIADLHFYNKYVENRCTFLLAIEAVAGYFRSDITVVCKAMEFGQFPLDSHDCYFLLTSCRYPGQNIVQALHSFHPTSWLRPEKNDPAGHIFLREGKPENPAV